MPFKLLLFLFGLIGILCLFLMACDRDSELDGESPEFIFGNYFGFCVGDCAHLYLLKDEKLYPDLIENIYRQPNLEFAQQDLMDESKVKLAEDLLEDFPEYLISYPDSIVGCPDCVDQGGYYLQLNNRKWHIDTELSSIAKEIRPYITKLSISLEEIKK